MHETDPLLAPLVTEVTDTSVIDQQQEEQQLEEQLEEQTPQQLSWRQRIKVFAVEYGTLGIVVHLVLSLAVLALVYIAVSNGLDVAALLAFVGIRDTSKGSTAHAAGTFVLSYALFKLLAPVRIPLTFAVTPLVLRALRRRGFMLPPPSPSDSDSTSAVADSDAIQSPLLDRTRTALASPLAIDVVQSSDD